MKFILNDTNLIIEENMREDKLIVSGSENYYQAEVEYNDVWKDLIIVAKFIKHNAKDGEEKPVLFNSVNYDVDLDGTYSIGFVGYKLNEKNEKTFQICTELKTKTFYKGAGQIIGKKHIIPSASEWEVYIAQIKEMLKDISVSGGAIDDVQVDGVSVVNNRIANIDLRQTVINILVEYGLIQLDSLTKEQLKALNEMECIIYENGELIIVYDETVLDIDFSVINKELIVDNNVSNVDFNINENEELEVTY